jgi:hypothetical protein
MSTRKTTWNEKLRTGKRAEVKRLDKPFAGMPAGGLMLVASPDLIDAYIRGIPSGRTLTVKAMRDDLADQHQAEFTCPTSTGIFLRIVAEAAWERYQAGETVESITPFWRVIEPGSALAAKLACGTDFITGRRENENAGR